MSKLRILLASLAAIVVTFGLFLFMQALTSFASSKPSDLDSIASIHFGPVEIPDEVAIRDRRLPQKPPPPNTPPPPPRLQVANRDQPAREMPQMDIPELDIPLVGGEGMFIGNFQQVDRTSEGDIVPVVVIRPLYPRDAAMGGIEGWVKIEFTITPTGTVTDARVVDADPPRIFNREAIRAISKWKFKPRVVDGVAVERRATQIIDFSLKDSGG